MKTERREPPPRDRGARVPKVQLDLLSVLMVLRIDGPDACVRMTMPQINQARPLAIAQGFHLLCGGHRRGFGGLTPEGYLVWLQPIEGFPAYDVEIKQRAVIKEAHAEIDRLRAELAEVRKELHSVQTALENEDT